MADKQSPPASGVQNAPATQDTLPTSTLNNIPQPILNHLQLLKTGNQALPDFASFRISRRRFAGNREHIEGLCKRFDYDPVRRVISFKMISKGHHYHTKVFERLLGQALNDARSKDQVSHIIDQIRSDDDLPLTQAGCQYQPNRQFWHSDAKSPGLVFEVGFAQNAKSLKRKAKHMIYQMNGEVITVVCFDLPYGYNGTSIVSVYRAHYDSGDMVNKCDMQPVVFHSTSDGEFNRDSELVLNLRDFAPPKLSKQCPELPITIKFAALAKAVEDATKLVQRKRSSMGVDANVRKRTPSSSSGDSSVGSGTSASSDPRDTTFQTVLNAVSHKAVLIKR